MTIKLLLTGIAALFLATGAANAETCCNYSPWERVFIGQLPDDPWSAFQRRMDDLRYRQALLRCTRHVNPYGYFKLVPCCNDEPVCS